jgi:citrate synthase
MSVAPQDTIATAIWSEEAEPANPFATHAAYCRGYDVYGQMLGRSRWVDMLHLLFCGEIPTDPQAALLETLSVALASAGPRDPATHAAMCAGSTGSTAAASLMAALAVGAGRHGGAREVFDAVQLWQACGPDLPAWQHRLAQPCTEPAGIWPAAEHAPGFDPHALAAAMPVRQTLLALAGISPGPRLQWLAQTREALELAAGAPLSMVGVAAAAYADLGLTADASEMLHLLLRLPGAAAHAVEQRERGHRRFPFFALDLMNDPDHR